MTREAELRKEIIEAGRRLFEKDFVASNDGNISVRLSESELLITPTGVSKGFMTPDQILKVDFGGNLLAGFMKPTSEMKMHLAVYHCRSDVQAVVHAHPPTATGFAVAGEGLDKISLPEVVYNLGQVKLSDYATPTTEEVPRVVAKEITCCDAMLLANHGALTVGSSVMDAYYKMETLEAVAKITLVARSLGNENVLSDEQKQVLYAIREKMGKPKVNRTACNTCELPSEMSEPADSVGHAVGNAASSMHLGKQEIDVIVDTILKHVSA